MVPHGLADELAVFEEQPPDEIADELAASFKEQLADEVTHGLARRQTEPQYPTEQIPHWAVPKEAAGRQEGEVRAPERTAELDGGGDEEVVIKQPKGAPLRKWEGSRWAKQETSSGYATGGKDETAAEGKWYQPSNMSALI